MLPYILRVFVFIGCSDSDLEDIPNFNVEFKRVFALNLLGPLTSSSLMESSN